MPSPLPGMDPYLEDRALWPDVHSSLIAYTREALQPQIRPKYIARRGQRRRELEVYAVSLRQRLPRCRIPLRPPDPDAVLDLPAVFSRCYDVGGYDLLIDYSRPPAAPLHDEEATWLANLLQEKGLRQPSS